jgi:hypothetical protein
MNVADIDQITLGSLNPSVRADEESVILHAEGSDDVFLPCDDSLSIETRCELLHEHDLSDFRLEVVFMRASVEAGELAVVIGGIITIAVRYFVSADIAVWTSMPVSEIAIRE